MYLIKEGHNLRKNMDFVNLKTKERYLFCQQNRDGSSNYFRATLLGIHVYGIQNFTTMICHHECNVDNIKNRIVYHMNAPKSINMAKTLVGLLDGYSCKFPDDVLNIINSFW